MLKKPLMKAATLAVAAALLAMGGGMVQAQSGGGYGASGTSDAAGMGAGTDASGAPLAPETSDMPASSGASGASATAGMADGTDPYRKRESRRSRPRVTPQIINDSTYLDPAYGDDVLGPAGLGHSTRPSSEESGRRSSYSRPVQ